MLFFGSLGISVVANVLYHIFLKCVGPGLNPVFSLFFTYLTATLCCLVLCVAFGRSLDFQNQLQMLGWPTFALGPSICFLEIGFILSYRAGWKLNSAALACNVAVGLLLIPISNVIFRESMTRANTFGVILSLVGLYLLTAK